MVTTYLLFLNQFYFVKLLLTEPKTFCWTEKPEAQTDVEKMWGFCRPKLKYGDKIGQKVEAYTFSSDSSQFTSSAVALRLIGNDSTAYFFLSDKGIHNEQEELGISLDYIGDIETIELKLKGEDDWTCRNILISSEQGAYNFNCTQALKPMQTQFIDVSGTKDQKFTTFMSDNDICSTGVRAKVVGSKISSPQFTLEPGGFASGQVGLYNVKSTDVGLVKGIIIDKENLAIACTVSQIMLTQTNEGEVKQWKWDTSSIPISMNVYLKFPTQEAMEVDTNPLQSKEGRAPEAKYLDPMFTPFRELPQYESEGADQVDEELADSVFDGNGCLSPKEALKIINITCQNTVKDLLSQFQIYGEIESGEFPNYKQINFRCPRGCNIKDPKTLSEEDRKLGFTNVTTTGVGIHPMESPICPSAIIDRAMPVNGGVITVALAPGLSKYDTIPWEQQKNGIKVLEGYSSKLSQIVGKVDNIDMISNNVRLIDAHGKVNSQGRVEIRTGDTWVSVCGAGKNSDLIANLICQAGGQRSGQQFLLKGSDADNKDDKKCQEQCANEQMNRMSIDCPKGSETLFECNVMGLKLCRGGEDLVANCFDYPRTNGFPNFFNSPITSGIDRFYPGFYQEDKRTYLCDGAFRMNEANIQCKSIGQDSGVPSSSNENDVPIDGGSGVYVQNVQCPKGLKSVNNKCRVMRLPTDQDCSGLQQVVACKGNRKVVPMQIAPLVIPIRLPQPKYVKASCDTTAIDLKGDPGSVQIVKCPDNCDQNASKIQGVGVYDEFSSICKSAVQFGAMYATIYSLVMVSLNSPQMNLQGGENNKVMSASKTKSLKTFSVFRPNSCALFMTQIMNDKLESFMQISSHTDKINTKFPNISFMQKKLSRYERRLQMQQQTSFRRIPLFIQSPSAPEIIQFNGKNQYFTCEKLPNADKTLSLPDKFTMLFGMKTTKCPRSGTRSVFSTGPGGWEFLISPAHGKQSCTLIFRKQGTNDASSTVDMHQRPKFIEEYTGYAIVFQYGTMRFYANGTLVNVQHGVDLGGVYGANTLIIGRDPLKTDRFFEGGIRYFAIFPQVLNIDEIREVNFRGVKPFPRPVVIPSTRQTTEGRVCISECQDGQPDYEKQHINGEKKEEDDEDKDIKPGPDTEENPDDSMETFLQKLEKLKKLRIKAHNKRLCSKSVQKYASQFVDPLRFMKESKEFQQQCPKMCLDFVSEETEPIAVKLVNNFHIFGEESSICSSAIYQGIDLSLDAFLIVKFGKDISSILNNNALISNMINAASAALNIFTSSKKNNISSMQLTHSQYEFILETTDMFLPVESETTLDELVEYNRVFQNRWKEYETKNKYNPEPEEFKFMVTCKDYPFTRVKNKGVNPKDQMVQKAEWEGHTIFSSSSSLCDAAQDSDILKIGQSSKFRISAKFDRNNLEFKSEYLYKHKLVQVYRNLYFQLNIEQKETNVWERINLVKFKTQFTNRHPPAFDFKQEVVVYEQLEGNGLALTVDKTIEFYDWMTTQTIQNHFNETTGVLRANVRVSEDWGLRKFYFLFRQINFTGENKVEKFQQVEIAFNKIAIGMYENGSQRVIKSVDLRIQMKKQIIQNQVFFLQEGGVRIQQNSGEAHGMNFVLDFDEFEQNYGQLGIGFAGGKGMIVEPQIMSMKDQKTSGTMQYDRCGKVSKNVRIRLCKKFNYNCENEQNQCKFCCIKKNNFLGESKWRCIRSCLDHQGNNKKSS